MGKMRNTLIATSLIDKGEVLLAVDEVSYCQDSFEGAQMKFENGLKCFRECLEIRKGIYRDEPGHPSIRKVLGNMAPVCNLLGKRAEVELFREERERVKHLPLKSMYASGFHFIDRLIKDLDETIERVSVEVLDPENAHAVDGQAMEGVILGSMQQDIVVVMEEVTDSADHSEALRNDIPTQ